MGFVVNPYDPCIANKIVNGHQLTLRSHVDNLMISHVDMSAINDFLQELKVIYGDSLTESTGKQHDYLGMIFGFSSKNEMQINMNLYISTIIKESPEEIIGKTSTPAGDHLFRIREDGCKLDDEMQTACWASSRQYAIFLGVCCLEVTIETTCRVDRIVCCDTKKEMKMKIMRLKVRYKNEGPLGALLSHDLVPGQLQDYHDLVPGQFQKYIILSCIDS
jgi:hypothetical protein